MADLRQILSQGRKRIGLLVGAGSTISIRVDQSGNLAADGHPIIPGVDDLTKLVVGGLEGTQREAAKSISDELGTEANIESILSKIRLLERALGKTKINGLDGEGYAQLGQAICDRIGKIVNAALPIKRNAYNEIVAWISGTAREHAVEIFTTNYDLLFEEAFEQVHASYFDGFSGGNAPFFDPVSVAANDLPSRWSRLWKLHGSLGWALQGTTIIQTGPKRDTANLSRLPEVRSHPEAALYGSL